MVHSSPQGPETDGEMGDSGKLLGELGAVPATQKKKVVIPLAF